MKIETTEIGLWQKTLPTNCCNTYPNSPWAILHREGIRLEASAHITGNNSSYNINLFKIVGAVRILDQYAIITSITALTNMTNVYADVWDGTVSVPLTADGITLSNAPVGTLFTKDKDVSEPYSVMLSNQARINEVTADKRIGKPFIVNQKNGVDTFIRFNYTTNTVLDFTMDVFFIYHLLDGGSLTLV